MFVLLFSRTETNEQKKNDNEKRQLKKQNRY